MTSVAAGAKRSVNGCQDSAWGLVRATERLAEKLHERYGVDADPIDLLDALAEAGLVVQDDDGGNHARRAWHRVIRTRGLTRA